MEQNNQNAAAPAVPEKKKLNLRFIIILAVLVIGGAIFGITKYIHGQHHEETDNAQVDGNVAPIIPRVAGYIREVRVRDNQMVHRGDTLLILDDRDYVIKVQQAEAALTAAQSNLGVAEATTTAAQAGIASSQANVGTANAQIEAARVRVRRAQQDYDRYSALIRDHSITQQQFEQAQAEKEGADRQLQVLVEQRNAAATQSAAVASQSNATGRQVSVAQANIQARQADVEAAKLNLSYTVITAPADGYVGKVSIQPGQLVQQGQQLFSLVMNNEVWVTANFKETQLEKMTTGQKVEIHVDALGGAALEGKVASISRITGSKTSLLPADNASGNFVKVVQRVPVRIEFDNKSDNRLSQLRAGMNVLVDVHLD